MARRGTRWRVRVAGCVCAALLAPGCKPAAFAQRQADLLREPPPLLPSDANAFWNDPATGVYGEFSVGPGLFRRADAVCRSARVTSIDEARHSQQDRMLLYCARPGEPFQLDATLACRPAAAVAGLTCRGADGDDVTLPPA